MKTNILTMMATTLLTACGGAAPRAGTSPEAINVGEYEVYVLQESAHKGSTDILIDAPADVLAQYAPAGSFPMATNAVLIRKGDRVWLVDTGYGQKLFDNLAALGIEPSQVQQVFITHMHGDHIGGLLRDGEQAFPNAVVSLSQREFDHWSGSGDKASQAIFAAYSNAVQPFEPVAFDSQMGQGITPIAAYGHTPGHVMFLLKDGDAQLLIWGDLAHAMAVQMPHPEISVTYDSDPDAARDIRLDVLRWVSTNNIPVVGMHIPATTAGHLSTSATQPGYQFQTQ